MKIQNVFYLTLLIAIISGTSIYSQTYSGPAFGTIAGGDSISTIDVEGVISPTVNVKKIFNPYWEKISLPLVDDVYNNTPALAPLGSNFQTDLAVTPNSKLKLSDPPSVVNSFHGYDDPGNYIPPDPHFAAGPNHLIGVENGHFIIYDKAGNTLQVIDANVWFNNVVPGVSSFDCQVIYDHFEGRWVQVWLEVNDATLTSNFLVSVSDDSDPFGNWCNFAFPGHLNGTVNVGNWGDYPKLGFDHQAIYISGRQFRFTGGFDYSKIRIIPKDQLYANNCGPVDYTDFWDFRDPANTSVRVDGPPIAALHYDVTDTAYIVVDSPYNTSTFITLWKIGDPLSPNPTVSATNIPTTAAFQPPDANQLGGGTPRIDSGRRVYRTAVYKDGNIWTSTAIAGGTNFLYAYARYLRLDAHANTTLEDVALGADGHYYMYPAAMVDRDNNLVMVFTRSADSEYAGMAYTGRKDTDTPGLSPSEILKTGESNYVKTFSGTRNRWGDYMGIALDPVNTNTIWGFVEYAGTNTNQWAIWTGAFTYEYTISGMVKDLDSNEPINLANLDIVETGYLFDTDTSGMYDFGTPEPDVTVNLSAFGYYDTSRAFSLTSYVPEIMDIEMRPLPQYVIMGQVKNTAGESVEANIEFFTDNFPGSGPYQTVQTDTNGMYSLQTLPGNYDIFIYPELPYYIKVINDTSLAVDTLLLDIVLDVADVLLVDDDSFSGMNEEDNVESYYLDAMFDLIDMQTFNYYDIAANGYPEIIDTVYFDKLIWFTGSNLNPVLSDTVLNTLTSYLDQGGKLFMSGQNIITENQGDSLFSEYMKISLADDSSGQTRVYNLPDDSITTNFPQILISGEEGADNQISQDIINVETGADPIFRFWPRSLNKYAGSKTESFDKDYKVVFLSFGFEAITDLSPANSGILRTNILDKIYEWFEDPILNVVEERETSLPLIYELKQNYPNPFNPTTKINYSLAKPGKVKLVVYDILGREVTTLVNETKKAGKYEFLFDGKNYASGVYFYRIAIHSDKLEASEFVKIKKMVLIK